MKITIHIKNIPGFGNDPKDLYYVKQYVQRDCIPHLRKMFGEDYDYRPTFEVKVEK